MFPNLVTNKIVGLAIKVIHMIHTHKDFSRWFLLSLIDHKHISAYLYEARSYNPRELLHKHVSRPGKYQTKHKCDLFHIISGEETTIRMPPPLQRNSFSRYVIWRIKKRVVST